MLCNSLHGRCKIICSAMVWSNMGISWIGFKTLNWFRYRCSWPLHHASPNLTLTIIIFHSLKWSHMTMPYTFGLNQLPLADCCQIGLDIFWSTNIYFFLSNRNKYCMHLALSWLSTQLLTINWCHLSVLASFLCCHPLPARFTMIQSVDNEEGLGP